MGATLAEKLIARGTRDGIARAGEIVSVAADRILFNDYVGSLVFEKLEELGLRQLKSPEKVFLAIDHNIPAFTVAAADKYALFQEKAKEYGFAKVSKMGQHGIGHQMMAEGFAAPLEICVGTDSHATMYAGIGAFSCGITASDAISALATGEIWMNVPESIRITITGELPPFVTAKDVSLHIIRLYPEHFYAYKAVEIVGEAVEKMSVESRLVIANMIAETGAKCAVFEADEKSYAYTGHPAGERITSDPDAVYAAETLVKAWELEPLLACPDSVRNVHPLREQEGVHVDQVFIGSCTNGRIEDLRQAAGILRGRKVAEGTRLLVTPASQRIFAQALSEGIVQILTEAGATFLPSSCASCAGSGPGLIGRGEVCVSTTNRNFKGRMGSTEGKVYLGSALAAAAAAVTGEITHPARLAEERR